MVACAAAHLVCPVIISVQTPRHLRNQGVSTPSSVLVSPWRPRHQNLEVGFSFTSSLLHAPHLPPPTPRHHLFKVVQVMKNLLKLAVKRLPETPYPPNPFTAPGGLAPSVEADPRSFPSWFLTSCFRSVTTCRDVNFTPKLVTSHRKADRFSPKRCCSS